MVKVCSKCKVEKSFLEFVKCKKAKDGFRSSCKLCRKEYSKANKEKLKEYGKQYREANKERLKEYKEKNKEKIKEYREKNKEYGKQYGKKYREANKEKIKEHQKEYKEKNKEKIKEYGKQYRKNNKERIKYINSNYKERKNKLRRERKKVDPLYKMTENLRARTYSAFKNKGYSKNTKTQEMLGVDWGIVKKHIERGFTKGMNWSNYGEWHIDHIIPLASAKTPERLKQLCHYTNLQPLWAIDNLSKSDSINGQQTMIRI